jgi:hypothetical protein
MSKANPKGNPHTEKTVPMSGEFQSVAKPEMQSKGSLNSHLGSMKGGDESAFTHKESGKQVKVRYESEQAMGDNGAPARGYKVGYYHIEGPGEGDHETIRHTPHGPTLTGAKQYAADRAAERVSSLFRDRRDGGGVRSDGTIGGQGWES